jgi:GAF domain-containing protein
VKDKSTVPAAQWSPADYTLRGEFCPLSVVEDLFHHLREAVNAQTLIHLCFDSEIIMRSLCLTVAQEQEFGSRLTQVLQKTDFRNDITGVTQACIAVENSSEPTPINILGRQDLDSVTSCLSYLMARAEEWRASKFASFATTEKWSGVFLNHMGREGIHPQPGELRSIILVDRTLTIPTLDDFASRFNVLAVALKCTAYANSRRDSVVMQQMYRQFSLTDPAGFEEIASQAIKLAMDITNSSAGAIYLQTSEPVDGYRRISVRGTRGVYPEVINHDDDSKALARVVSGHRAAQLWESYPEAWRSRTVEGLHGAELITPIAGPLASPWAPAVGAISLFRQGSNAAAFSAYDLALIRNLSLRLALLRTTNSTSNIARAIANLRSHSRFDPKVVRSTGTYDGADGHAIPRDIQAVVQRLDGPLKTLSESTYSHSVTLRVALPSANAMEPHGLALVRVAAYPRKRLFDEERVQNESKGGINWKVAQSGNYEYAADVKKHRQYLPIRPRTASQLCLPVRTEGALVGVLNLESTHLDNYASMIPLLDAFCGALGRTLADARAAFEQEVLDRAAHTIAKRHDIDNFLTELNRRLQKVNISLPAWDAVNDFTLRTRTALEEIRRPPSPEETRTQSLGGIIGDAISDLEIETYLQPPLGEESFEARLGADAAGPIRVAITNVLRNLNQHSALTVDESMGHPPMRISYHTVSYAGVDHAVVLLENYADYYVDSARVLELYRFPLDGPDGALRLGAFLAGLNARRAGARVHSVALNHPRMVRTTIMIPIGGK